LARKIANGDGLELRQNIIKIGGRERLTAAKDETPVQLEDRNPFAGYTEVNILLATAHPYIPEMAGGMQNSSMSLAQGLQRRGHNVSVLSGLIGQGWLGFRARALMKATGAKAAKDLHLGFPVWRAWFVWEAAAYVAERERPDVVVVMARKPVRVAEAFRSLGLPIVMWLLDVEFKDHEGAFERLGDVLCVANSRFTAGRYNARYGVNPRVIHPIFKPKEYIVETTRRNVTFINPNPAKGLSIAVELARHCPEIPFQFVEAWPLDGIQRAALMNDLASLPNVTFCTSVRDMRQIYGTARILLAPSQWEEGYGRVATEAHFSGIPVLASDRGGLPEAVGDGGVLLGATEPVERWVRELRRLWNDNTYYSGLSNAAIAYSQRGEIHEAHQIENWECALREATTYGGVGMTTDRQK
jgi:glycosyltransferase involved in cell wall biosynthesis